MLWYCRISGVLGSDMASKNRAPEKKAIILVPFQLFGSNLYLRPATTARGRRKGIPGRIRLKTGPAAAL
jgi:hypothetical protein